MKKLKVVFRNFVKATKHFRNLWTNVRLCASEQDSERNSRICVSYSGTSVHNSTPIPGTLTANFHIWMEASRYAYKCNIILNSVRQDNYFITQGNYIGYMFRLWIGHLQAYFCHLSHKMLWTLWDPIGFTSMEYTKLNHLSQRVWLAHHTLWDKWFNFMYSMDVNTWDKWFNFMYSMDVNTWDKWFNFMYSMDVNTMGSQSVHSIFWLKWQN